MATRRAVYLLLLSTMFVFCERRIAAAQASPIVRAAISGGVGLAEGTVVSLAVMVARARFGHEFIESPSDIFGWGWRAVPVLAGPVVGLTFGLRGEDPFVGSMLGSAAGLAIGATAGGLIGKLTSDEPTATWAGAIIGAGAGLTLGRLLFGVLQWSDDDDSRQRSITLSFRVTP